MIKNQEQQHQPTILVVDDDRNILAMLEKVLAMRGFRVMSADNAEKAIVMASCEKAHINILLSDVNMPGMNGIE